MCRILFLNSEKIKDNRMRKLLLIMLVIAVSCTGLYAQRNKKKEKKKEFIECLYFHRTKVCPSCVEIKKCLKEVFEEEYNREIKKGKLVYNRIDFEVNKTNKYVKEYMIEKPTLYIVYHKKGRKSIIDLTMDGFKYALHQPERFKKIVMDNINTCFR